MSMPTDRRARRTELSNRGTTLMSHRCRQTLLVIAVLVAGACAPHRPASGALAPVSARGTNEMRLADLAVIDGWERHRADLLRNDGKTCRREPSRSHAPARGSRLHARRT